MLSLKQVFFLHFLNRVDHSFLPHFCQRELALLNSRGLGGCSRVEVAPIWLKLTGLPLPLQRTASVPRKKIKLWILVTLAIPSSQALLVLSATWSVVFGQTPQVSPEAHLCRGQMLRPSMGSHRVSSVGGRNHGAGRQAQPQGGSCGGASGKGAPEGSPSAYTRISGGTGKLRANPTCSEEAGGKALNQFW